MSEQNIKVAEANSNEQENDGPNIADIIFLCISKWYWIVTSVLICLVVAYLYIRITPPTYQRTAAVLIKEDNAHRGSTSELAELSGMSIQTNIHNEILTLKSPTIMSGVVKELGLDVIYQSEGFFYDKTLYGKNLPYCISFINMEEESLKGLLTVKKNKFTLNINTINGKDSTIVITGNMLDSVKVSDKGKMIVSRNLSYKSNGAPQGTTYTNRPIIITKLSSHIATQVCLSRMTAELADKNADVINLSYTDVSVERATDVANTVIKVYNENWLKEKNQITVSTSKFIDERLQIIEKELGSVDNSISTYKSNTRIPDVQTAAGTYFSKSTDVSDQLLDYNNRRSMANYVRQQLSSNITKNQLLPANSGIDNSNVEQQIAAYNTDLLKRNNLAANSNEQNPLVLELDDKLAQMRKMILSSLDNYIINLNGQIQTLERKEAISNSQLSTNPTQAKFILSVERQQKVKEALYLFLLQKREENEVRQTFTAYNTRIINWAAGSDSPIAPSSNKIMMMAFVIGLIIPIGGIFLLEALNTTVRGQKDIDGLSIPYIGEIPYAFKKKNKKRPSRLKKIFIKLGLIRNNKEDDEKREIVVKDKKRDFINEAFRVVRTNLEFMLGHNDNKVVMASSFNAGSGKTFIGMNIAMSYAIKGKKVAIIDLDLRKGSLSTYVGSPKLGVSDYLNGDTKDYHEVIVSGSIHNNLDMIPCGTLPPNPSELLYSPALENMIKSMREEYDYIFIDCPPMEMLADASIINKYTDLTVFIIRVELFERNLLPKLESIYKEKKYNNMALILNGSMPSRGRYGYGKYGYGYGYRYGYGYEYGSYLSDDDSNK